MMSTRTNYELNKSLIELSTIQFGVKIGAVKYEFFGARVEPVRSLFTTLELANYYQAHSQNSQYNRGISANLDEKVKAG